jgi:tetratricopeptide (TPR) repeat protein
LSAVELARAAGRGLEALAPRARIALRDAGDRAMTLNALEPAERYYREALALAPEDERERIELVFRLGRVLHVRDWGGVEEISEARDGFLAAGDREAAAEAALILADLIWNQGNREGMTKHLDDARALVAGTPASRIHARVLTEVSRYDMLADRNESAIQVGREALQMAEQLGLDDIRAHALNNIGGARAAAGDPDGTQDLEESIALATRLNSVADMIRGYNNLGAMNLTLGRLQRARTDVLESYRLAMHFGHHGFARWSSGGPLIGDPLQQGRWDEVVAGADSFLADVGGAHYQSASAYCFRGLVRLGRADPEGAASDAEQAVDSARPAQDPQLWLSTLGMSAQILFSVGAKRRAIELLDEALEEYRSLPQLGFAAVWTHAAAWTAWSLGRGDEFLDAVSTEPSDTPWLRSARAIGSGDFRRAADIFGEIGALSFEAFYRLQAAQQLVEQGRRAEADEQLRPALAFYRSVGATRYVREGEALLAASA